MNSNERNFFFGIILHPNVEQILRTKISLLKKNLSTDFFPLYPLTGIFCQNDFNSKDVFYPHAEQIKAVLKNPCSAEIFDVDFSNGIYFYTGKIILEKEIYFCIPVLISKDVKDKSLYNVISESKKFILNYSTKENKKNSPGENISFKSFKAALVEYSLNQYSVVSESWIKITS